MILQVGVKVLLQNESGHYLLLKRSLIKYPDTNNPWDIPGGRINPGSPLLENLNREVQEETGLELTDDPQLIEAQDIFSKDLSRHIVRLTYTAHTTGEPHLDGEEHEEYQWITLAELKSLPKLDRYVKQIIDRL